MGNLVFLQIEESGLMPVGPEGVRYGDLFHVEARLAGDEPTVIVDLEWDGGAKSLTLFHKPGSHTYLSRPLRMVYDGAPQLIEMPEL